MMKQKVNKLMGISSNQKYNADATQGISFYSNYSSQTRINQHILDRKGTFEKRLEKMEIVCKFSCTETNMTHHVEELTSVKR